MTQPLLVPRSTPCASCPYRRDVPSGIWAREEYEKLPAYDNDTMQQPAALFHCHTDKNCICRGWYEVHSDSLAMRLAWIGKKLDLSVYPLPECTVKLFRSGLEACRHGLRGLKKPGEKAVKMIRKIARRRT